MLNMSPSFPIENVVYGDIGNSIFGSNLLNANSIGPGHPDFLDFRIGETGIDILFTGTFAAFARCIALIVFIGSKKEMVWVYTRRGIARMAGAEIFRNLLIVMQNPRGMRSAQIFTLSRIRTDYSVSIFIFLSSPKPAALRFLHILSKALGQWHSNTCTTAKTLWTAFCGLLKGMENAIAS